MPTLRTLLAVALCLAVLEAGAGPEPICDMRVQGDGVLATGCGLVVNEVDILGELSELKQCCSNNTSTSTRPSTTYFTGSMTSKTRTPTLD